MTIHLGTVRPGSTIDIEFETYGKTNGESLTMSGFTTSTIKVYKNGSTTERSSSSGFTLLDTDGIDIDSRTGVHGATIDLSDNTDSGFYVAGGRYRVVVVGITIDGQTVNFTAATFRIGYPDALLNTTLASLSSQTSFTLSAGSADDNAYVGWIALVHDIASAVQVAIGYISAYTGSSKTVTLAQDPGIFTMASGDNISLFPPVKVASIAADAITATSIQANAFTAAKFASGAFDGVWTVTARVLTANTNLNDLSAAGVRSALGLASANLDTQLAAIDDAVDTEVAAIKAQTDKLTFDGANHIVADARKISTSSTAADNLEAGALGIVSSTCAAGSSTTSIVTNLTEATDDHYNGAVIVFTGGALAGQRTDITDYNGTTKTLTVTALTEAPANTDPFVIV